MDTLTLKCGMRFPSFGLWKWKEADFAHPLSLILQNAKVHIFVHPDRPSRDNRVVFVEGHMEIVFSPPPRAILDGLRSGGDLAVETAQRIYEIYTEANTKFESLLMDAGGVRFLLSTGIMSLRRLFEDGIGIGFQDGGTQWKLNDTDYQRFSPPIARPRGRNPLYKAEQLVTPSHWRRMQQAADNNDIPTDELLELRRIRSKAGWRQRKIAVIEASIISEVLLRSYSLLVLAHQGFSNNKIKKLRDELTFNNLLNVVLPLSLTKRELNRVSKSIQAVDVLRGIRNDLVHGTIKETDVDDASVAEGIDGAIRLAEFLKDKLKTEGG